MKTIEQIREQIAINVRALRMEHNLTVRQLAKVSRLSVVTITSVENATREPSMRTLDKIAKGLGVHMKCIFELL